MRLLLDVVVFILGATIGFMVRVRRHREAEQKLEAIRQYVDSL